MQETSQTLLTRVRSGDENSWERLSSIYTPFIINYLCRAGARRDDAEDLTQKVMLVLVVKIPSFVHSGNTGAFRKWLRNIVLNEIKKHWRSNYREGNAVGGTDFQATIAAIEDPCSDLATLWDREHDDYVLQHLMAEIESEFESQTLTAFKLQTVHGFSAVETAEQLNMTAGAAYVAKSRVLRRLRSEAEGLIE